MDGPNTRQGVCVSDKVLFTLVQLGFSILNKSSIRLEQKCSVSSVALPDSSYVLHHETHSDKTICWSSEACLISFFDFHSLSWIQLGFHIGQTRFQFEQKCAVSVWTKVFSFMFGSSLQLPWPQCNWYKQYPRIMSKFLAICWKCAPCHLFSLVQFSSLLLACCWSRQTCVAI